MARRRKAWLFWIAATAAAWSTLPALDVVELAARSALSRKGRGWHLHVPVVDYEEGRLVVWYQRVRRGEWELWRAVRTSTRWSAERVAADTGPAIREEALRPAVLSADGAWVVKHDGLHHYARTARTLELVLPLADRAELLPCPAGTLLVATATQAWSVSERSGGWGIVPLPAPGPPLPSLFPPPAMTASQTIYRARAACAAGSMIAYRAEGDVVIATPDQEAWREMVTHAIASPQVALSFRAARPWAFTAGARSSWGALDSGEPVELLPGLTTSFPVMAPDGSAVGFSVRIPGSTPWQIGLLPIGDDPGVALVRPTVGPMNPYVASIATSPDGTRHALATVERSASEGAWIQVYESGQGLEDRGAPAGGPSRLLPMLRAANPLRPSRASPRVAPALMAWVALLATTQWLGLRHSGVRWGHMLLGLLGAWLPAWIVLWELARLAEIGPRGTWEIAFSLFSGAAIGFAMGTGQWLAARPAVSPTAPLWWSLGCLAAASSDLLVGNLPRGLRPLAFPMWIGRGITAGILVGVASGLALRTMGVPGDDDDSL